MENGLNIDRRKILGLVPPIVGLILLVVFGGKDKSQSLTSDNMKNNNISIPTLLKNPDAYILTSQNIPGEIGEETLYSHITLTSSNNTIYRNRKIHTLFDPATDKYIYLAVPSSDTTLERYAFQNESFILSGQFEKVKGTEGVNRLQEPNKYPQIFHSHVIFVEQISDKNGNLLETIKNPHTSIFGSQTELTIDRLKKLTETDTRRNFLLGIYKS